MCDWSSLPLLPLSLISERLCFAVDYIRFRSVCSTWRSAAPNRPHLPCLVLHHRDGTHVRTVFSFATFPGPALRPLSLPPAVFDSPCCGASSGWLALLDPTPGISLFNPVTSNIIHLPPITHFPTLSGEAYSNLGAGGYLITDVENGKTYARSFEEVHRYLASKVVLSSDPATSRNCMAVAIRCRWKRLQFCRLGDHAWTPIRSPPDFRSFIIDCLFHKGRFYIAARHSIYICDLGLDARAVRIPPTDPPFDEEPTLPEIDECYLVECSGHLLLVTMYYCDFLSGEIRGFTSWEKYKAEIYKLDWRGKQMMLLKLKSVGDFALFLGQNESFSLPASKFPGLKGNRIYMAEYYKEKRSKVRVINLKDGSNEFLAMDSAYFKSADWTPCAWLRPSLL